MSSTNRVVSVAAAGSSTTGSSVVGSSAAVGVGSDPVVEAVSSDPPPPLGSDELAGAPTDPPDTVVAAPAASSDWAPRTEPERAQLVAGDAHGRAVRFLRAHFVAKGGAAGDREVVEICVFGVEVFGEEILNSV